MLNSSTLILTSYFFLFIISIIWTIFLQFLKCKYRAHGILFSSSRDYLLIFVIKFMNYEQSIFFKIEFNYLYLKKKINCNLLLIFYKWYFINKRKWMMYVQKFHFFISHKSLQFRLFIFLSYWFLRLYQFDAKK